MVTRKKIYRKDDASEMLKNIQETYGRIPLVSQVLSRRPDIFVPYTELASSVMYSPAHLDPKTMEIAAVCASSALASEHCLNVHIEQASQFGATKEEIFESLMLGSFLAMTKSQSIAIRKFIEFEPKMDENERSNSRKSTKKASRKKR